LYLCRRLISFKTVTKSLLMGVKLRQRKLKKGEVSYHLDIHSNGSRYSEFLGKILPGEIDAAEKLKIFKEVRAKRELELLSDQHEYIPKHKKNLTFMTYYQSFIDNYRGRDLRLVRYSGEKFKLFLESKSIRPSNFKMNMLSTVVCQEFADFLKRDAGLSGETPYNYWTKFRMVLKKALSEKLIRGNPTQGIIVRRNVSQLKKEVLTVDEMQKLADTGCGNIWVKRAFLFACFTGLGLKEIKELKWTQINNGKINLLRAKTGEQIWNDLPQSALDILSECDSYGKLVFPDLPSEQAVWKCIKRWVEKAEINKNISFYCGRHIFAVQLMLNGANLKTTADCLGHRDTTHTAKYLNFVDSLKSQAISNLPRINIGAE
jgi:site-specific recombinase XerD